MARAPDDKEIRQRPEIRAEEKQPSPSRLMARWPFPEEVRDHSSPKPKQRETAYPDGCQQAAWQRELPLSGNVDLGQQQEDRTWP